MIDRTHDGAPPACAAVPARAGRAGAVARQLFRLAVILLAAVLVTGITVALASGPFAAATAGTGAPVGKPRAPRPSGQADASQVEVAPTEGQAGAQVEPLARPAGGAPGGRNVPNLQRGLPDLVRYGGMLAAATAIVVALLRVFRPRIRRGTRERALTVRPVRGATMMR